jgi:hypothetical protein
MQKGWSLLHSAAYQGHEAAVRWLVQQPSVAINLRDPVRDEACRCAACQTPFSLATCAKTSIVWSDA